MRHRHTGHGLLILAALAGCTVAPEKEYPTRRQHVLDVARPGAPRARAVAGVVKVRRFSTSPRFDGTELVYRTGDVVYETDFYNHFLIPPATLITTEVQRWMGDSGLFTHVVGSGSRLDARYLLEGNVTALYGDHVDPAKPVAVLEIQFFLIDESGENSVAVFHKTYRRATPSESTEPAALVKGLNAGLADILKALENDLARMKLRAP